jgi:hypothetical protein
MPELILLIRRIANICGLSKHRVIETAHGKFMVSPLSHLGYQLAYGEYEPEVTAVLGRYLKPDDLFVDLAPTTDTSASSPLLW